MEEGLAFTIEPVLVEAGSIKHLRKWKDNWTVMTADRSAFL
jgi:hypothetical protein